jgi:NADH-quinone oxidoreductase subunit N
VLGLVGSYLGIYFYLRVIQLMFMSPDAHVASPNGRRGLALGASVACVAAALLVAVFPGWVIGRL